MFRFLPAPHFRLKDLSGAFAVFKKLIEVEGIPIKPAFAPLCFADVFGMLAELGEIKRKTRQL